MNRSNTSALLSHSLSTLLLLLWAFAQAILMLFADTDSRLTYAVMLLLTDAAVLTGYLSGSGSGIALCGTLTCAWIGYKLYGYYSAGQLLTLVDDLLVPMPLLGAGISAVYHRSLRGLDKENVMLRRQVEDLVLVDDLTGMYNERAMYRDLVVMISYGRRNKLPISLMLVQPRYAAELKNILPARAYNELLQIMAEKLMESVRREDRVYAIDHNGTFALMLTSNVTNSVVVRNRISEHLTNSNAFEGILDRHTHLDLRFACKEYEDKYGNDMLSFKKSVESELVYDV